MAKRANGEQCTRRKKDGSCFCGTHIKGTPHGVVDDSKETNTTGKKVEVWVQEIKGINYYIDAEKNVYLPEDIISNSKRPRVIGTWEKQGDSIQFLTWKNILSRPILHLSHDNFFL